MKARDIMRTELVTVDERDSVATALQLMLWNGIRHLPVLRAGRLVGLLGGRDLLGRRSPGAPGSEGDELRVRDVMSVPAISTSPDAEVPDLAARMIVDRLGCLPVVDGEELVGIVTTTDLVSTLCLPPHRPRDADRTVSTIMTGRVLTARPADRLLDAAARMEDRGVRHLPVVDADGRVVGILSDRDVRRVVGDPLEALYAASDARRVRALSVEDAMCSPVCVVREEAPISQVQQLLADARFGAVPVVDADHRVVGIVSYVDVLRAIDDGSPTLRGGARRPWDDAAG